MPRALAGSLCIFGPLVSIRRPPGTPGLSRPAAVSPAVSVPVLVMAAPASVTAVSVPASFSGPLATSAPLGRPTPVPGFAPALAVSSAVAPVRAGASVIMASAAASATATAAGAKDCEPVGRPLLADVPLQTDEGIIGRGALQR